MRTAKTLFRLCVTLRLCWSHWDLLRTDYLLTLRLRWAPYKTYCEQRMPWWDCIYLSLVIEHATTSTWIYSFPHEHELLPLLICFNHHVGHKWRNYSWLSLSPTRLSRTTAYLEVKILSLPKHRTTSKKYCGKEEKLHLRSNSPLFHNIFDIALSSRVQLHINLLNVFVQIIFSSILKFWYVDVRISRSVSESPLEFEITRVAYI